MFIVNLLSHIFIIFIFGGFLVLAVKVWQWLDDTYLDNKIGGFLGKQNYVYLRIYPPADNTRSLSEMENFFVQLLSAAKVVKPGPLYLMGFWHEEYVFEFHSNEGRVGMFVRFNRSLMPLFETALNSTFPNASYDEVMDPILDWPTSWDSEHYYDNVYGTEIKLIGSEIHPLKSWRDYQSTSSTSVLLQDPVKQLFNSLESCPRNTYTVIQFMLRPTIVDKGKKTAWEGELAVLREKYMKNSSVEIGPDGKVSSLTEMEKNILNSAQRKINAPTYEVKTRFITFGKGVKAKSNFDTFKAYISQYATSTQFLFKNGESDTDPKDPGEDFGYIGPWVSIFKQKVYLDRESQVRQKDFYKAFINRSFGRGGAGSMVDVESLTSLIHFPVTTDGANDMTTRLSSDYGEGSANSILSTPPANLPG